MKNSNDTIGNRTLDLPVCASANCATACPIEKCLHTFNREQNRKCVYGISTPLSRKNIKAFFKESCYDCECLDVSASTARVRINVERIRSSIQLEPLNTQPETPLVSVTIALC